MFDHLGFGFSDKPKDYSYSLTEQAEQVNMLLEIFWKYLKYYINRFKCICMKALALWTKLGIEKAHVVSHDMGDSVLTEILTRCLHQIDFFKSQLSIDWNVAPCLIGLTTSSKVSSSPTEE